VRWRNPKPLGGVMVEVVNFGREFDSFFIVVFILVLI
jgi:hypothetical protein